MNQRCLYSVDLVNISLDLLTNDKNYGKSVIQDFQVERNFYIFDALIKNRKKINSYEFSFFLSSGLYLYIGYDNRTSSFVYARTLNITFNLPKYLEVVY